MPAKDPLSKIAACRRAVEIVREKLANPQQYTSDERRFLLGKYFQVKQVKSTIGLPKKMRLLMKGLGFKRLWSTVHVPVTKEYVGALTKARHLVDIRIVDELPPTLLPKDYGYAVVGNWLSERGNKFNMM